jgi:hypothetical protein
VGARPTPAAARSLTKAQLLNLTASKDVISFSASHYKSGHACDQPERFLSSDKPYRTEYSFGCEPYTVVPRRGIHLYDERFVGYGKNKITWNYELAARRPTIHVVPDLFLVHIVTIGPNTSKYGHFPSDKLVGETCWPAFRDRVDAQYNYSLDNCFQRKVDEEVRDRCASPVRVWHTEQTSFRGNSPFPSLPVLKATRGRTVTGEAERVYFWLGWTDGIYFWILGDGKRLFLALGGTLVRLFAVLGRAGFGPVGALWHMAESLSLPWGEAGFVIVRPKLGLAHTSGGWADLMSRSGG